MSAPLTLKAAEQTQIEAAAEASQLAGAAATSLAQGAAAPSEPTGFAPPSAQSGAEAMQVKAEEATAFLKKLANRDRLMLVCALVEGERPVRWLEETLAIRQPGLSQQLTELRSAGIIQGRKDGKQMHYRLADPRAAELIATLYRLFCAPPDGANHD